MLFFVSKCSKCLNRFRDYVIFKKTRGHLLLTDTLYRNPTPKGGASQLGYYLSERGARPGCNRAGIFIYAYFSYRER